MRYYTSDSHFDDVGILTITARARDFTSLKHYGDYVIDRINETVTRRDTLYILGDFGHRRPGHFRARINCKSVHLIIGNHDKASYYNQFSTREKTQELKVGTKENRQKLFMSHYPHFYWPASHHQSYHIYGHMHDDYEKYMDQQMPGRRSMDVSLDSARRILGEYRPFSEDEIISNLEPRPGHHHVNRLDKQLIRRYGELIRKRELKEQSEDEEAEFWKMRDFFMTQPRPFAYTNEPGEPCSASEPVN